MPMTPEESDRHTALLTEVRYAERLCDRTARLYRRLGAGFLFLSVATGSAALSALSDRVPPWVSLSGGVAFALVGAINLAVRPADKAAQNEADARKYARLRSQATRMTTAELEEALQRVRESDAPEVEPLREVAYNDVVTEIGRKDMKVPLGPLQRTLALLA